MDEIKKKLSELFIDCTLYTDNFTNRVDFYVTKLNINQIKLLASLKDIEINIQIHKYNNHLIKIEIEYGKEN
jgi:hypothetical protein